MPYITLKVSLEFPQLFYKFMNHNKLDFIKFGLLTKAQQKKKKHYLSMHALGTQIRWRKHTFSSDHKLSQKQDAKVVNKNK